MEIKLNIPERFEKRNLYLFAGLEPVLRYRQQNGYWEVKVADCSRCGKCCRAIREDHPLGTENGCRHLQESGNEWLCGLTIFRPYGCAIAEMEAIEDCTVKWKRVK